MTTILLMLGAFFLGGVPFGWLLARASGVDVRFAGSGNIGATNVARTAGRGLGLATLGLDALKGVVPVMVGASLEDGGRLAAAAACAAVLGHVFSPYLGFRGGKGVATAAGAFLALAPGPTAAAVVVFGAVALATRVVALGSIAAALALPVAMTLVGAEPEARGLAVFVSGLVLVRHVSNLRRLLRGPEGRETKPDEGAARPNAPS